MRYRCFHCQKEFEIQLDQLGASVVCPHCESVIDLPEADAVQRKHEGEAAGGVTGSWFSSSISGLVSVVVHIGLLLCFALVTCEYRGLEGEAGEEVRIGELPAEILTDRPSEERVLDTAQPETRPEQNLDDVLEVASPAAAAAADTNFELEASILAPSGGGGAPTISALAGGGGAVGEGASFMGVHAKGTRFCIIADRSGSMDGPKLAHVKEEILETLSTMGRQGRFQLIFFNSGELAYPHPGWRHPRRERPEVARWLQGVNAEGGTYPTPAFREAFQLSPPPDAIFFMTDGQFPDQVVSEIDNLNRSRGRRVVIHTISFMDTSSGPLMQRIAADSGGKYRHVSGF